MGTVRVPGSLDGTHPGRFDEPGCPASRTFFSQHMVNESLEDADTRAQRDLPTSLGAWGCWKCFASSLNPCDTIGGRYYLDEASKAKRLNDLPKVTQQVGDFSSRSLAPEPPNYLSLPQIAMTEPLSLQEQGAQTCQASPSHPQLCLVILKVPNDT